IMGLLSINLGAATSGNLLLRGLVTAETAILITPEASAVTLDLSASPTNLKVATSNEKSNSASGYTISVSSVNNGFLANGVVDSLAYELSYGGSGFATPTTAGAIVKTQSLAGVYNVDSDVNIRYTGKANAAMAQGTYEDTLTFTISAI
ncbi:fimbrial protein, partial [bacterium]|nr:fimbrial protein [bacterium]